MAWSRAIADVKVVDPEWYKNHPFSASLDHRDFGSSLDDYIVEAVNELLHIDVYVVEFIELVP